MSKSPCLFASRSSSDIGARAAKEGRGARTANALAFCVTTVLLLPALGCTKDVSADQQTGLVAESSEEGSVIVGAVNWQDVGVLGDSTPERINSRAVGYLSIPARGTRCTGFLVAPDLVMTNEHCIPQASSAQGVRFSMRRETGVPSSQWETHDCSTFVGNNRSLDYALLRCSTRPGDAFGIVSLEARQTRTQDALYVIHQNCDFHSQPGCNPTKKISRGSVVRVNSEIGHDADTLGGSSGSPVFASDTHAVFGLHHVGIGGNSSGRGSYNKAVPMRDILDDVAVRFPAITFGPDASAGGLAPDAFEPNDDASSATTAPPNASGEDFTITSGDKDVFRVDLPAAGALTVDVTFAHADGDIDVELLAGSLTGAQIAKADSASDNETLTADVEPGTVYLVVFGYNGATNGYDIRFSFTPDAAADTSEPDVSEPDVSEPDVSEPDPTPVGAEPNDSRAEASLLQAPVALFGVAIDAPGDEDFYRVEHTGGELTATLEFTNSDGDLDLFLYTADGTEIVRSNGVTDQERISQTLVGGTYFLRVIGYQDAVGAYEITLD